MKNIYYLINLLILVMLLGCMKKEHRVIKTYFEDGSLESEVQLVSEGVYGEAKYYHPNGKLRLLVPYLGDKINGQSFEYFEDGSLEVTKVIKNDKLHGWLMAYYRNGQVELKTKYSENKPEFSVSFAKNGDTISIYDKGRAIRYFENGEIEQITCSQNEDLKSIKNIRFSSDGKIIKREQPLYCLTRRDSLQLDKQYPSWKIAELNTSAL